MKYERIKYPDGQISAKITEVPEVTEEVIIEERINSYEDLFYVRSLASILNMKRVAYTGLFIPCLFGQRSDRKFSDGQSYDLKLIAEVINACGFDRVVIFDPHSDVALAVINNSYKLSSEHCVKKTLDELYPKGEVEDVVLVSPDAGAYKKVFEYGEHFKLPVVAAVKHRDKDGKIDLQFIGDVQGKDCLIVDDLLDGGYTFHLLGEKLKQQGAKKVYLYISHAYFNKGVDFTEHIDHFFCTNSVKDIEHPKVTQYKII